ncbi:MAG: zinc-dependent metalloprotease [Acidobacteria bacterium]|nr:zinc-dependent metalloprotease [Acidobacteriota bacterium]
MIHPLLICLVLALGATAPRAQEPQEPPAAPAQRTTPGQTTPEPQAYDKVITAEARSKPGLFTVHQVKEKYYYEIPAGEIDKEFLWVTQIARTTLGAGFGGQSLGSRVVRWERNGNRVFLREINYEIVADKSKPIAQAVRAANNDTILISFPIAAFGKDEAPVIEVSRLFTTEVTEFSARSRLRARGFDATRSYVERVSPFPENIEAEATHTYTSPPDMPGSTPTTPRSPFGGGMRPGSATVVLHFSMVKLPEKPMMPRLFDERVGYFTVRQMDYGRDEEHRAPRRTYITRWRLEKMDPAAALSEPVKPIVFWLDTATPTKWVPYMKRGVEKWQAAFEEAGFKNAIIARMAPTAEENPDFSPEDARYSVIRWLPSTVENAFGPHIHDPRTGEILESDIQFHHNIMNLQRSWYFLQAGAVDPRARTLPFPDDLMGVLLEYVTAHEVGHSLGFQHNMKASSTYPAEKVRDKEWVRTMGHTPTLMDYSRNNYVAQPEDGLDVADLVPGIGPYDRWATMWGYKPIPEAKNSDEEKSTLDTWARAQDETPWLRFSTPGAQGSDPGDLTEAVGDADAVKSTELGLRNLQRVAKMLLPATTAKQGEPYDDLSELYGRMLGQWTLELNHVAAIVGGMNSQQKHIGQAGVRFTAVPKARQVEAVRFLHQHAFATPLWAINPEILRRIEPSGALQRIRTAQQSVLNNLLNSGRFARLIEQEAIDGAAYPPVEFLTDVRRGIWRELESRTVKVDAYRRNLQRAYLELINTKLNATVASIPVGLQALVPATSGDEKPYYRAELRALNSAITAAMARTTDRATRAHLDGARDQINKILDPRSAGPATATTVPRTGIAGIPSGEAAFELFPGDPERPDTCWPDYRIGTAEGPR